MARSNASGKHFLVLACIALLGVALVADFLWASSNSAYSSPVWSTRFDLSLERSATVDDPKRKTVKKDKGAQTLIPKEMNATFADLPAPQLQWEEMAEAPVPHSDQFKANFPLNTQEWSVVGRMPFRIKTTLVGYWDGWLYFTSGQRDKGPNDPAPKKVVGSMWRTKLHL
ncbi:hypothetical protein BHE74_00004992 [Ensete ventricosum]|uniref:Uncharacterized protein n=1 Tax=Ensete ventricosum TaxID=4639 RepID=A0A427BCE4_ENSVE|nr:hypothetical protein B296_00000862 [Ensete ventricosum]RWW35084.1 hypothetical protein GW17_00000130 [Ensete ventricosum]RWW86242.1 hypothetical protein BHE74_00004992 [Ensete ventricosum]RZR82917.1 hypothetical protein BHM03_00009447 [Ensete ventricosum]